MGQSANLFFMMIALATSLSTAEGRRVNAIPRDDSSHYGGMTGQTTPTGASNSSIAWSHTQPQGLTASGQEDVQMAGDGTALFRGSVSTTVPCLVTPGQYLLMANTSLQPLAYASASTYPQQTGSGVMA